MRKTGILSPLRTAAPRSAERPPSAVSPGISVIVPAYNSELSLADLAARLHPVLAGLTDAYELVIVNDGSRDRTWPVVENLVRERSWIRGINLSRNYGQHNAVLCGIRAARFEVVVTMDDDLQHPPEAVAKLVAALAPGVDVVYGVPETEQHGLARDLASWLTKVALRSAMGVEMARHVGAFRAFRTRLRDAFETFQGTFVSVDVLLTWGTTRFAAVRVPHDARRLGRSNYTLRTLAVHALNMVTGFTTWPLRFASIIGFAFTLFGIVVLAYVLGRLIIQGTSVPGFPFLASVIAIFSGAELFALGIIGEYLARMYARSMDRPTYIVSTEIDAGSASTMPGD